MRVYGALMWSLGKIVNTPEVEKNYGHRWGKLLGNHSYGFALVLKPKIPHYGKHALKQKPFSKGHTSIGHYPHIEKKEEMYCWFGPNIC